MSDIKELKDNFIRDICEVGALEGWMSKGKVRGKLDEIEEHHNTKFAKLLKDIVGESKKSCYCDNRKCANCGYNQKRQETIDKINNSSFKDLVN
jgi:hypothetical protein